MDAHDQPSHVSVVKATAQSTTARPGGVGEAGSYRVVAMGGGHGLSRALESMRDAGLTPSAIVSVADNGGSTGVLRRDYDIPAIGDIRRAMRALMPESPGADMFMYRYEGGSLSGHALGNLMLLAYLEQGYSLVDAIGLVGRDYGMVGQVFPATSESVTLYARDAGKTLRGQVAVQTRQQYGRPERIWIEPKQPLACQGAIDAIGQADFITLGPGSLFTSLLPVLMVPGIRRALLNSHVPLLYIANTTTQAGETDSLTLQDHVEVVSEHFGHNKYFDVLIHEDVEGETAGYGNPLDTHLDHPLVAQTIVRPLSIPPAPNTKAAHDRTKLHHALEAWMASYIGETHDTASG